MHIPEYAKGTHELWTPQLMRDALVHAIRVMRSLPGGGYTASAAGWVDFNDAWGYADDKKVDTRVRPTAIEISQMERILVGRGSQRAWLNGPVLGYKDHRRILIRWAIWVAHGCRNPDGEQETDLEFSRRIGQSEATMKRHRDFAAGVMADHANRIGVEVWYVPKPTRRRKSAANLQATGSA